LTSEEEFKKRLEECLRSAKTPDERLGCVDEYIRELERRLGECLKNARTDYERLKCFDEYGSSGHEEEYAKLLGRTKDPCFWVEGVESQLEKLRKNGWKISQQLVSSGGWILYSASKDSSLSSIGLREDVYRKCIRKRKLKALLHKLFSR